MKKFLLVTISFLLFLSLALTLAIRFYMSPERLSNMATEKLDNNLEVEIQSASLNPFYRTIMLEEVTVFRIDDANRIDIFNAEVLTAESISVMAVLRGNVAIGQLSADRFSLDLTALPDHSDSSDDGTPSVTVNVRSFDLQNGELIFSKGTVTGINVTAGQFTYDQNQDSSEDPDFLSHFHDIDANIDQISYRLEEDRYLLQIESLFIHEAESSINVGNVSLETVLSEPEFFNSYDYRNELINLDVSGIAIDRADFSSYRKDGDFIFDTISMDSLYLHVTLNKQFPAKPDPDTVPMPLQILKDLPMAVALDSLSLGHGEISYSEYAEDGVRPGTVLFAGIQAAILNIDNRSDDPVVIRARSLLENTGELETEIRLFIDESGHVVTVKGSLGEFDLTRLNNIFKDLEGLEITDGIVYDLEFDYRMTDINSTGSVLVHYDGFNINIISKDDYSQSLGDHLSGFFINQIAMRASSRSNDQEYREGSVGEERNPEKGLFNYLWISLRSGLLDVVNRI
jgi:hypothetical protein